MPSSSRFANGAGCRCRSPNEATLPTAMTALGPFFDSYYRLRPVNATFTGVHAYDHLWPDWSPEGLAAAADEMRALRTMLVGQREARGMTRANVAAAMTIDIAARDRELAISFLDVQLAEDATAHFQRGNPSLALGEAAFGVISLITRPFAPAEARAEALAARLDSVPAFLDGAQRSIRGPIPEVWRAKCLRECEGVDILFREGVDRWAAAEALEPAVAERLARGAVGARAGLGAFRSWLSRETSAAGSSSPPPYASGAELFDLLLARGHWCDRSRSDLAAAAAAALDEAIATLEKRARRIAPDGWPEVQRRLADMHPSTADYLETYQRVWDACRERSGQRRLLSWPDAPIRYVPIPTETRDAAPYLYYLFYRSPAPFDRLPVHDYVVTPIEPRMTADEQLRRLRATNTSVIKLNHVVHHGAIGHHVQNHQAYSGPSEIGRVAAVDCASRIGMFLGGTMAEGWACYATDLMDEVDFLTPEESVSQQHTRARLLARAVVDIGLHEGSLTFDEAVAVYRDRVGLTPDAAAAEACKNSMFPGTAVMYWLGTDGLHRLRRARARDEGAAFSLESFHDRVLSFGSIPVPLLSELW
jgi:hypothetical protein